MVAADTEIVVRNTPRQIAKHTIANRHEVAAPTPEGIGFIADLLNARCDDAGLALHTSMTK